MTTGSSSTIWSNNGNGIGVMKMADNKQVALSIKNITKIYGKKVAADHVSFDIHRGEIFGFLGPNGAGKTTVIKSILGFIFPDERPTMRKQWLQSEASSKIRRCIPTFPQDRTSRCTQGSTAGSRSRVSMRLSAMSGFLRVPKKR